MTTAPPIPHPRAPLDPVLAPRAARPAGLRPLSSGPWPSSRSSCAALVDVAPRWTSQIVAMTTVAQPPELAEATRWVADNVPRDEVLVVHDAVWTDMVHQYGFAKDNVIMAYKLDADPAVQRTADPPRLPRGARLVLHDQGRQVPDADRGATARRPRRPLRHGTRCRHGLARQQQVERRERCRPARRARSPRVLALLPGLRARPRHHPRPRTRPRSPSPPCSALRRRPAHRRSADAGGATGSARTAPSWLDPITEQPQARWLNGFADLDRLPAYLAASGKQDALPVVVAYAIPNRGCSNYREGLPYGDYDGSTPRPDSYAAWIKELVKRLGPTRAVVVLEPDALPADCFDDERATYAGGRRGRSGGCRSPRLHRRGALELAAVR